MLKNESMAESKFKMRPSSAGGKSYKARSAMFRDVVMLFYATTDRLRALRRLIASSVDLNAADYSIVAALYRLNHEPGVRVREVADYLHLSPENVTTAVQRLVKAKWIVKAAHPNDARSVTLRLNAEARERIDQLTFELREVNELWFGEMTTAEIKSLIGYLEHVLDGFDRAYDEAREKLQVKPKRWRKG
jgi:DNA-binding MarR family transcriptional regulator